MGIIQRVLSVRVGGMFMKRFIKSFTFSVFVFSIVSLITPTYIYSNTWTVFMYADSSDALSDMAIKNISDALFAKIPDNVTIAIQLHAFGTIAYRYIIKQNTLIPVQIITLGDDRIQNFVDGAQWAFGNYQSDNTMVLLWDHGHGALDPQWNDDLQKWMSEPDVLSSANNLEQDDIFENNNSTCPLRSFSIEQHQHHRGYMFSAEPREYLTNNDLITAFDRICKNLGRMVDIVGFDTCMGSMLEIGYQFVPFARYLVGVQSCASKDGWNYGAFGQVFDDPAKTPGDIAKAFVKTFQDYYQQSSEAIPLNSASNVSGIYTLTALDLSRVTVIKMLLDQAVQQIAECVKIYGVKPIRQALRFAHSTCYNLCLFPMYTDMYTLIDTFNKQINLLDQSIQASNLSATLTSICAAIEASVIGHCSGQDLAGRAHGLSIYFPHYHIDPSYQTIRFGRECAWGNVLTLATAESL